ncbi:MAG: CHAT domain-containing protein [Pelatocladus maniniholoensis HA4357-MV3]|jgi:hypothetical protein|uniref:CHAT domain-containing protein n=1 Tax=Pelatocladus maniniholoensis HA4357-MV3 TaxID=1117104 RepID=A0A9E3H6G1_9NOST|nr:CHAT domain-containing protein [Pelatocladus maniniholoensis HA4357-MV3]
MNSDTPIKILFLAADPSNASRLRLGQELRDIKERLQIAKERDKYLLEQRESVRIRDITQAIFDVKPQIIHFSGHGTSKGELAFENEVSNYQLVEPEALAAMFELFAEQVKCVVLNACYSETQAKAIAEYIPFVIGMNDQIGDKAAIAFAVGFYKALAGDRTIEDAHQFGCIEIRLNGIPEHLKPVIHVNKSLIITAKPRIVGAILNPFIPQVGRVEDPQQFFGRKREIERVFETLNSGSSVALIGERSIGKSSLLWAIRQQAETRLTPPRKPIYLNLNEVSDEKDFYEALCFEVGIQECRGYALTRVLKQQRPRLLLLLDEIEKMTWQGFSRQVREQLRGLAEGNDAPLRLVVAASVSLNQLFPDSHEIGMTSPFQGICIEERMNLWDETTAREFISHRLAPTPIRFTDAEIMQIVKASCGHPKELMQLCYRTYARYVEGMQ